jgi:hypothetical protein
VLEIDHRLRNLGKIVDLAEPITDVLADVRDEQAIERLQTGHCQNLVLLRTWCRTTTHLSEQFVNVAMALRDALHKVIKLIDEIPNIDAAHRERLWEWHCPGEAQTAGTGSASHACGEGSTYVARCSASPGANQHAAMTCSNSAWSLTDIGWLSSSRTIYGKRQNISRDNPGTYLIEIRTVFPLQEIGISLEHGHDQPRQRRDVVSVSLETGQPRLVLPDIQRTHLQRLLKPQYTQLDAQKRLGIFTPLQPIRNNLHDRLGHFIPQLIDFPCRAKGARRFEDVLFDDEEADEVFH